MVAVGAAVTRLQIGDEVYCESSTGSYAEFTRVPEKFVAFKPESLTLEQAGCVPVAAVTALQGLRKGRQGGARTTSVDHRRFWWRWVLRGADRESFGATVTGVCSTAKVDLVRSLGPMPSSTTQPNRSVITMANST